MKRIAHIALLAVGLLAIGIVNAAPALGASFHSDSSTGNTILTGESTGSHVFDLAGSTLTCTAAKAEGTQTGKTSTHITLSYGYSLCTLIFFGFKTAVTVNMGGCAYTYSANGVFGVVDRVGAAKPCAQEPITYRVSNFAGECDVAIGPQMGLTNVTYTGTGTTANGAITLDHNFTALHYTSQGNLCSAGTFSNGAQTSGSIALKGYVDVVGVEGAQTPIWVTH
jgi:hypothetical protein